MEVIDKRYYARIGESFSYGGITLLTVKDTASAPCYFKTKGLKAECVNFSCCKRERSDKTGVKFIQVGDIKDGKR